MKNNLKIISTRIPEKKSNACSLQRKPKLSELNAKTTQSTIQKVTAVRGCETPKPRTGHILDWKTNALQNMSRNVYDCIFLLLFVC